MGKLRMNAYLPIFMQGNLCRHIGSELRVHHLSFYRTQETGSPERVTSVVKILNQYWTRVFIFKL